MMKAKCFYRFLTITLLCLSLQIAVSGIEWFGGPSTALAASLEPALPYRPIPFLHRPYYGARMILQRTNSYFDHDKPWYAYDNFFVRFDGFTWRGDPSTVSDCYQHISCYDGHNGYDLNLWYEPVLSAAGGRVIRAGWYNPLNHSAAFGLWVAIDHGNGFVSAYAHLSALNVSVGNIVGTQTLIGKSGTTGASTGPHLHMSVYYLPAWQATDPFGWRGHGRDPNVVPDWYLWVSHPGTRTVVPYQDGNRLASYPGALAVDDEGSG